MEYIDEEGRIPTYYVEKEYSLLENLPDSKPSKRIIKSKKGLKAIKALIELREKYNMSWYQYLKYRNNKNLGDVALFYRGNKVTFNEMFKKADEVAKSMVASGIIDGDEIGVCVSNTPELVYILLAANKIGVKLNLFGADYNQEYISHIMDGVSKKVIFISDDNYDKIANNISSKNFEKIIVTSLCDSLPLEPKKCDEYEPELADYYSFENKAKDIIRCVPNTMGFLSFVELGKMSDAVVTECGDLETDFLVTYTSGSTKIGFPKAMIHKNRSLNVMGRFHDPELCGNPKIPRLRGLAHIHPDSNTNIITCISDNLMQGWSVAMEPIYSQEKALDLILLNKPNYLDITTSFLLEAAKQYLMDRKYHEDGQGRKLPFLLATFAVGEGTRRGEEKFINRFLRDSRAGSGVKMKGFRLPFTSLSIGGGDCEHGGIYYTLWKVLYQRIWGPMLGKEEIGLLPVPYVVVTCLKQNKNGEYEECDYFEKGIIVANSYSNLSCYKDNAEETEKLILEDKLGRKWVSCKTYGYIDNIGSVHVKGRIPEKEKNIIETYEIDDIIGADSKNILSTTTVEVDGKYISTIQLQPFVNVSEQNVYESIRKRLSSSFSPEICDLLYIRFLPCRESYPITIAGKRSFVALEHMGFEKTRKLFNSNLNKTETNENQKKLVKK